MSRNYSSTKEHYPIWVAIIVGGLFLVFIAQIHKDYKNYRLLKQEAESLTKKNNQIQEEIKQLEALEIQGKNEESLEKQARLMFGFKKAGEEVVMVVPPQNEISEVAVTSTTINTTPATNSFINQWWSNLVKTFNNLINLLVNF